jgi:hypothetical protein
MSHTNDLHYRRKVLERLKYLGWSVDQRLLCPDLLGVNDKNECVTLRLRPDRVVSVFLVGSSENYTLDNLPKVYMDLLLERTLFYCEQKALREVELEEQREAERLRKHKIIAKLREKNLL